MKTQHIPLTIVDNPRLKELLSEADDSNDPVNKPKHYTQHPSGIECIQVTEHYNFNVGNAIKYLWRNGLKDVDTQTQDLEKAVWYIQREIQRLKRI